MRKSSFGHRPGRGKPHAGRPGGKSGGRPGSGKARSSAAAPKGDAAEHQSPSRKRYLMRKALSTPREEQPATGRGKERSSFGARFGKRLSEGEGKVFRKHGADRGAKAERDTRGGKPTLRVRPRGPHAKHGQPQQAAPSLAEPMRIAKAMARVGLCSRREAERWIEEGRVSVNGRVLKTPGVEVKPGDRVLVDGKPLPVVEPSQLWRYHKPKGTVTTHNDPQGRPTVFDNLPPGLPRVISVGRLDFNTEGLILLTNDGELARHLELPATGWLRRYRVRAKGRVTQQDLDKLKDGVEIEGVRYGPVEAQIDTVQGANMWITIGIREGKNREVRKVLSNLGLDVNRLIRISFGPFQLLDLEPGDAEVVKRRVLADQLGPEVATQFGLVEKADDKPAKGKSPQKKRPKRRREDA